MRPAPRIKTEFQVRRSEEEDDHGQVDKAANACNRQGKPHLQAAYGRDSHRDHRENIKTGHQPSEKTDNPHRIGSREEFEQGFRRLRGPGRKEDRRLEEVCTPYGAKHIARSHDTALEKNASNFYRAGFDQSFYMAAVLVLQPGGRRGATSLEIDRWHEKRSADVHGSSLPFASSRCPCSVNR